MKTRITLLGFVFCLFALTKAVAGPPDEDGKMIFTSRCAACHNVNKMMTGPALAGVNERRSIEWIINFIHSPQTMIKKGDKDAVALLEKFKITMPDHPDLTAANIKSIVEYIKSESKPADETVPFAKPGKASLNYLPLSLEKNYYFFIFYLVIVVMLIVALLFAVRMKNLQRAMEGEKDQQE